MHFFRDAALCVKKEKTEKTIENLNVVSSSEKGSS